jgi:hypothetical protein
LDCSSEIVLDAHNCDKYITTTREIGTILNAVLVSTVGD